MLLIDEVDKSDQEFEAFLLEILSDYQVTITGDRQRHRGGAADRGAHLELHARLGRRAQAPLPASAIGFPDEKLEGADHRLARARHRSRLLAQLVAFVQQLRGLDLKKLPSVSESIDWARVMVLMHASVLAEGMVRDTLNVLLKFESDIEAAGKRIAEFTQKAQQATVINR